MPPQETEQDRWFAAEVQPHEPALRAYLRRKYPTLSDVDDFVQEAFLKALVARRTGRLTSARGFLFHVARNSVVSFFRKRRRISSTPVSELPWLALLESDADVIDAVCTLEEIEIIAEAIAELPGRCRQVVLRRLTCGLEYDEIARELGISEPTVRVQVARGMRKCSEFLRQRGVIGEELP